ncbi:LysR family transcriptional regulator [Asaia sp. HN010]|uniref:LysR family transcriptional regulator n=1 Tax=Asaia sp. HN010 TaxID=3081233 RepID=UPI003016DC2C
MKSLNEQIIRKITLRYLHFIDVICETQSLVAAAAKLNITPAALSKSCLEIERILGVQLFIRSHHGMQPTDICTLVVESSRSIGHELDKMVKMVNEYNEIEMGALSIGVQAMGLETRIMKGVSAIKKASPGRTIRITHRERNTLIEMLNRRELDMIFIDSFQMDRHSHVSFQPMLHAGCVAVSRQGARSVREIVENWAIYRDDLWILPQKGIAIRDRFDALLYARDLEPPAQLIEYNSYAGLRELFYHSGGWGIIPSYALHMAEGDIDLSPPYETMDEMQLESGLAWLGAFPQKKYVEEAVALFTDGGNQMEQAAL